MAIGAEVSACEAVQTCASYASGDPEEPLWFTLYYVVTGSDGSTIWQCDWGHTAFSAQDFSDEEPRVLQAYGFGSNTLCDESSVTAGGIEFTRYFSGNYVQDTRVSIFEYYFPIGMTMCDAIDWCAQRILVQAPNPSASSFDTWLDTTHDEWQCRGYSSPNNDPSVFSLNDPAVQQVSGFSTT